LTITSDDLNFKNAQIFDLTGKMILSSDLESPSINVETLSKGTYIILLLDENNNKYTRKFIKE
jgi:hypothetical protein